MSLLPPLRGEGSEGESGPNDEDFVVGVKGPKPSPKAKSTAKDRDCKDLLVRKKGRSCKR